MSTTLVVGASGGIAQALIARASKLGHQVLATSAKANLQLEPDMDVGQENCGDVHNPQVSYHRVSYEEASIEQFAHSLKQAETVLDQIYICHGILHGEQLQPEKRLEDLTPGSLQEVMYANTIIPILWLKHLKPLLKGKHPRVVTVFSARVGSIEDNRLGGWYSYRASKAALNMLVKSAAVEYARVAKATRFLVFHPGTVDTPLSKPFQKSVAEDKLFSPEFVAERLTNIVDSLKREPGVEYLDWDQKSIPW